ncbi:MAG: hypothetical protein ACKO0W_06435 [Planctomycetota bacterium]
MRAARGSSVLVAFRRCLAVSAPLVASTIACAQDAPYASAVIEYLPGTGAVAGFTNPAVALGAPERFTGEGLFPQCVTPFQPAYRPNEVVSIGSGGRLVLALGREVRDEPANPYGIDLLVFGNSFFTDSSFGFGVVAGLAAEGGRISLSADGTNWTLAKGLDADGLFPTLGYLDVGPFATIAGAVESDFHRPVDPTISLGDLVGLDHAALVDAYDRSGGGAGIDIGALGLAVVRFVRIDGPSVSGYSAEIDAVTVVIPAADPADLDGDGSVGAPDLAALLGAWGSAGPFADLDGDGSVGAPDLAALLAAWDGGGA